MKAYREDLVKGTRAQSVTQLQKEQAEKIHSLYDSSIKYGWQQVRFAVDAERPANQRLWNFLAAIRNFTQASEQADVAIYLDLPGDWQTLEKEALTLAGKFETKAGVLLISADVHNDLCLHEPERTSFLPAGVEVPN